MKPKHEYLTKRELRHFYGSFLESVAHILIAWIFFGGLCYGAISFTDYLLN